VGEACRRSGYGSQGRYARHSCSHALFTRDFYDETYFAQRDESKRGAK